MQELEYSNSSLKQGAIQLLGYSVETSSLGVARIRRYIIKNKNDIPICAMSARED